MMMMMMKQTTTTIVQSQVSLTLPYQSYTQPAIPHRYSPLGAPTPTQLSGIIHTIDLFQAIPPSSDLLLNDTGEELIGDEQIQRVLCTTEVIHIHNDPILVLQHLCSAFHMMSSSYIHQHPMNVSPCLFKFHKSISTITYHPINISYTTDINTMINFNQYPNNSSNNVNTLIAVEDLGRGSSGKAWLCITNTTSHPTTTTTTSAAAAVCVVNFNNYDGSSVN